MLEWSAFSALGSLVSHQFILFGGCPVKPPYDGNPAYRGFVAAPVTAPRRRPSP